MARLDGDAADLESFVSDRERRRRYAWIGILAIAVGSALGIVALAID